MQHDQDRIRLAEVEANLTTRVDRLDATMRELAEQQRFIVRGMRALTERDRRFEKELTALRDRLPT